MLQSEATQLASYVVSYLFDPAGDPDPAGEPPDLLEAGEELPDLAEPGDDILECLEFGPQRNSGSRRKKNQVLSLTNFPAPPYSN